MTRSQLPVWGSWYPKYRPLYNSTFFNFSKGGEEKKEEKKIKLEEPGDVQVKEEVDSGNNMILVKEPSVNEEQIFSEEPNIPRNVQRDAFNDKRALVELFLNEMEDYEPNL